MRLIFASFFLLAAAYPQSELPSNPAALSAKIELGPALTAWKSEIERTGRLELVPARIYVVDGAYVLPEDLPHRTVLMDFFRDAGFREQFVRTHALNINWEAPARRVSFVLLNMHRMPEFSGIEDDLLSHEFGHVWLHARGLRAPTYTPGTLACEAVHSGDIVQHLLIRREQDRRGFVFRPGWIADLSKALAQTANNSPEQAPTRDLCQRLQRLSLLTDLTFGLQDSDWDGRQRLINKLGEGDPKLRQTFARLASILERLDINDRIGYYAGLGASRAASQVLLEPE